MAQGMSVNVLGVAQLATFLKVKSAETKRQVAKGIINASIFLQGEVKESIAGKKAEAKSVDTGLFLNSVGVKTSAESGEVFSKLPYAGKLEYGTNFKNSPRKHFRNSADRSKDKIATIIQSSVNVV